MAKRLGELEQNYLADRKAIHNAASEMNAPVSESRFKEEYPEGLDW